MTMKKNVSKGRRMGFGVEGEAVAIQLGESNRKVVSYSTDEQLVMELAEMDPQTRNMSIKEFMEVAAHGLKEHQIPWHSPSSFVSTLAKLGVFTKTVLN